jgi:uncharacterized protein (DUF488 family)
VEILTFGHGTASADEIVRLLTEAGAGRLVDIRTAPGSRHNPHVRREEIERWLPEHGIAYRWEKRLGGWRQPPARRAPDTALRNRAFAGYAAHVRTTERRADEQAEWSTADREAPSGSSAERARRRARP